MGELIGEWKGVEGNREGGVSVGVRMHGEKKFFESRGGCEFSPFSSSFNSCALLRLPKSRVRKDKMNETRTSANILLNSAL